VIAFSRQGIPLYAFHSLSRLPGLVHAVTTRAGGVSPPPFDSLNLAEGEDDPEHVARNRKRLQEALGIRCLLHNRQVHGDRVVAVGGDEAVPVAEADGLATDRPGVGLLVKQADCQAVVLVAPERRVVANLHVGWRGNVVDLPGKGVAFLQRRYGVEPGELWAAVSPSLGPCCAEFVNYRQELPASFLAYRVDGVRFDLWRVTRDQLLAAGLRPERIEVAGVCTRCDPRFFSYRRRRVTGRFGTVVALAE
jgi:hypothetical protein